MNKKPNPEVYRLAAEAIQNDDTNYTCIAIYQACRELGVSNEMYSLQYEAMFGPFKFVDGFTKNQWGDPIVDGVLICNYGFVHPFWNKEFSEERKQYRIMALLLMAEMCENPNN